ncbi:hypothetical protein, partial [Sphingobacterium multivorum]
ESRSVPFFTRKPLLETVKGFFRLDTCLYFPVQCYCISSPYWLSQHRVVGEPDQSAAVSQLSLSRSGNGTFP